MTEIERLRAALDDEYAIRCECVIDRNDETKIMLAEDGKPFPCAAHGSLFEQLKKCEEVLRSLSNTWPNEELCWCVEKPDPNENHCQSCIAAHKIIKSLQFSINYSSQIQRDGWGAEIPGATQVKPGLYVKDGESGSIFTQESYKNSKKMK